MAPKALGKHPVADAAKPAEPVAGVPNPPGPAPAEPVPGKAEDYAVTDPAIQAKIDALWVRNPLLGTVEYAAAHIQSKGLQYVHGKAGLKAGTTVTAVDAVQVVKAAFEKKLEAVEGKEPQQQAAALANMRTGTHTGHPYRLYANGCDPGGQATVCALISTLVNPPHPC